MYSSKKIKAIKALNIQKAKLDDPTYNNDWVWVAQTGDIVKKYIGEKSVLYANISTFTFTFWHLSGETDDGKRQQAKNFIDSCIEFINEQGIYKESTENFLSKIKVDWLVAFIFTGGSILFYAGWFFADLNNRSNMKDLQNSNKQLEMKNNELRDSIKFYQLSDTVGH